MTQLVPNEVPVVEEGEALAQAHSMGSSVGDRCDEPLTLEDVSRFKEQARWINNYSRSLKALAGSNYEGEYIVLLEDSADIPANGHVVRRHEFYDTLVDEFNNAMIEASQELGDDSE